MLKEDRPVDRRMVVRDRSDPSRSLWWAPTPLTWVFTTLFAIDALMLLIASGVGISGNDAAGNGMANAFQEVFVEAATVLVACLALLFLLIRHRGTRIGLALITLMLPMLLQ